MSGDLKVMEGFNIYHDYNNAIIKALNDLCLWTDRGEDESPFKMRDYQLYTLYHKQAFMGTQISLMGHLTLRGILHDTEKLVLYAYYWKREASELHKEYSRHHYGNCIDKEDLIECVIDYECARVTKADKPLNAYQTIMTRRPRTYSHLKPILQELGIDSEETKQFDFSVWNSREPSFIDNMAKLNISAIEWLYGEIMRNRTIDKDHVHDQINFPVVLEHWNEFLEDPISAIIKNMI